MGKIIASDTITVNRSASDIFSFLSDFRNFSPLMPEQVRNWEATNDACSFEVSGLATLGMRITDRQPNSKILMLGEGKLPFGFTLCSLINQESDNSATVRLEMDTDMSAMIAMMAEKPLYSFINMLVIKLKEVMENPS